MVVVVPVHVCVASCIHKAFVGWWYRAMLNQDLGGINTYYCFVQQLHAVLLVFKCNATAWERSKQGVVCKQCKPLI